MILLGGPQTISSDCCEENIDFFETRQTLQRQSCLILYISVYLPSYIPQGEPLTQRTGKCGIFLTSNVQAES